MVLTIFKKKYKSVVQCSCLSITDMMARLLGDQKINKYYLHVDCCQGRTQDLNNVAK